MNKKLMKRKVYLIYFLIFIFAFAVSSRAMADKQKFYLDTLNETLTEELEELGILPPLSIEEVFLVSGKSEKVISPSEAKRIHGWKEFTLADMELNDSTRRFSAEIVFAGKKGQKKVETLTIKGKFTKLIEVPVLREIAHRGEVISDGDIDWITYSERKIKPSIITDARALIGKTPKRRILANSIIRTRDIDKPILIEKGEPVTLVYQTQHIRVQTIGLALQDGRKDESIRIQNRKSKKVVQGIVEDKGLAVVNAAGGNTGLIAKSSY